MLPYHEPFSSVFALSHLINMLAPRMARVLANSVPHGSKVLSVQHGLFAAPPLRHGTFAAVRPPAQRGFTTIGRPLLGAPKGRLGKGTDDRVVSAVVPSKTFLLTIFNGTIVLDSIYNRVVSTAFCFLFGMGVILFWQTQTVYSFLTMFLAVFGMLWLQMHVARAWVLIPCLLALLYKLLE